MQFFRHHPWQQNLAHEPPRKPGPYNVAVARPEPEDPVVHLPPEAAPVHRRVSQPAGPFFSQPRYFVFQAQLLQPPGRFYKIKHVANYRRVGNLHSFLPTPS